MITGTTSTGFSYSIPDTIKDDYEILEALADLQRGKDFLALPILVDRVMGDQKAAFKDHCRDEEGRVATTRMMEEFFEIFSSNEATKK